MPGSLPEGYRGIATKLRREKGLSRKAFFHATSASLPAGRQGCGDAKKIRCAHCFVVYAARKDGPDIERAYNSLPNCYFKTQNPRYILSYPVVVLLTALLVYSNASRPSTKNTIKAMTELRMLPVKSSSNPKENKPITSAIFSVTS